MDFSKFKNKLLIVLCLFVLFFPFYLITFTYASSNEFSVIDNLYISIIDSSHVKFIESSGRKLYYTYLEKNHSYKLTFSRDFWTSTVSTGGTLFYIFKSSDIPSAGDNGIFIQQLFLTYQEDDITIDLFVNDDSYYYFGFGVDGNFYNYFDISYVTLDDVTSNIGQIDSVNSLVDNVGINQIWGIFNNATDYIYIVIIFAFGAYIIFRIIRKITKGKEGL